MKRKVCVVVTARPSYSRVKTALEAIRDHRDLELQLVVAASTMLDRYGAVVGQIEADGFDIAARVFSILEGENLVTMAKSTGLGLMELATVFDNLKPDIVVTIADRFETIATAIAASYMNIPLAHIQGGEVTGSIDEKVRHAITKLADLHLVSTSRAADRVLRMGENRDAVHNTGCPSIDQALFVKEDPGLNFDPNHRYGGVGTALDIQKPYLVVMHHPVTTEFSESHAHAVEVLTAVHELGVQAAWFWPNPDAGSEGTANAIRSFRENHDELAIHFFKNMSPTDFLRLIDSAGCLLGNSSAGIREAAFLGVPVVNIGSRQMGRERGPNVADVDCDRNAIKQAISAQLVHGKYDGASIYGDGHSGQRIADVLASATLTIAKRLAY